jgi:hypothetical protein
MDENEMGDNCIFEVPWYSIPIKQKKTQSKSTEKM